MTTVETPAPAKRSALMRAAWLATWPVRWYWAHSKRQIGKRLVVEHFLKNMYPPPPAGYEAELPGGRVFLHYRSDIGLTFLLSGAFEPSELQYAIEQTRPGTAVIDVGANIGMYTVPLAHAVGPAGSVIAVEPAAENMRMLEHNLSLNDLRNVKLVAAAATSRRRDVLLQFGHDAAFHSTNNDVDGEDGEFVQGRPLDDIWSEAGRPDVSFLKIDTEGGEIEVMLGAAELLEACRPAILVEARTAEHVRELDEQLLPLGYSRGRRRGFANGNHLYSL